MAVLQTFELWIVVSAGGIVGCLWSAAAVAVLDGHPEGPAVVHGLRAAMLTITLTLALIPLLAAWLVRTDLVAMLKERPG